MNHTHTTPAGRVATGIIAAAAVAAVVAGVARSATSASPDPESPVAGAPIVAEAPGDDEEANWDPATPIWVRASEQRRLCQIVSAMPAQWPATIAMRRQAERPLGSAAERAQWRHDAELMPSYWPAAERMVAAADGSLDCEQLIAG
jgi:hypothetical protein